MAIGQYKFKCERCRCGFTSDIKGGPKYCPVCKQAKWRTPARKVV